MCKTTKECVHALGLIRIVQPAVFYKASFNIDMCQECKDGAESTIFKIKLIIQLQKTNTQTTTSLFYTLHINTLHYYYCCYHYYMIMKAFASKQNLIYTASLVQNG